MTKVVITAETIEHGRPPMLVTETDDAEPRTRRGKERAAERDGRARGGIGLADSGDCPSASPASFAISPPDDPASCPRLEVRGHDDLAVAARGCTVPSASRSIVRRRPKSSTTPSTPAIRTCSPALNWFSATMKMPDSQSLISACAPKPIARPAMPRPAMAGPMSTLNCVQHHQRRHHHDHRPAIRRPGWPSVVTRRSSSTRARLPALASLVRRAIR